MKEFIKQFTFTKNETKVIIFTVSILFCGFVVKYYNQILTDKNNYVYDFSKDDSIFNERSSHIYKVKSLSDSTDTSHTGSDDSAIKLLEQSEDSLSVKEKNSNNKPESYFKSEVVNINTATKEELIGLPGIGEATAMKILDYRQQKKGFKKIEDIMNVKGIGKKKFENLKNFIKTE